LIKAQLVTSKKSMLTHILLGSTTEKVVRHAACPVLMVREYERELIQEPRPS
jgi:hypothetical protein